MSKVSGVQSKLDDISVQILEAAAEKLINNLSSRLAELKAQLAVVKKSKKPMPSKECRNFLFALIGNPVLFQSKEAQENLGFMDERLVEKIQGDRCCEFDPGDYWDERDSYDICLLVLKVAERYFKDEYVKDRHFKLNALYALSTAVRESIDSYD